MRVKCSGTRDNTKQDWASDQSCWQTQQPSLTHSVSAVCLPRLGLFLAFTVLSWLHPHPHISCSPSSSLHISPTWAFIPNLQLNPIQSLSNPLWFFHSSAFVYIFTPWSCDMSEGSQLRLRLIPTVTVCAPVWARILLLFIKLIGPELMTDWLIRTRGYQRPWKGLYTEKKDGGRQKN